MADKANRTGVTERFPAPAVQKSMQVDLALIDSYAHLLGALELHIVKAAKQHEAQTVYLLQTVPGMGKILSCVLLHEMHDLARFPSVQDLVSYCRLVKGAKESVGTRINGCDACDVVLCFLSY